MGISTQKTNQRGEEEMKPKKKGDKLENLLIKVQKILQKDLENITVKDWKELNRLVGIVIVMGLIIKAISGFKPSEKEAKKK